jgi:hypothetical protein
MFDGLRLSRSGSRKGGLRPFGPLWVLALISNQGQFSLFTDQCQGNSLPWLNYFLPFQSAKNPCGAGLLKNAIPVWWLAIGDTN